MKNVALLRDILGSHWLIDQNEVNALFPLLKRFMSGEMPETELNASDHAYVITASGDQFTAKTTLESIKEAPEGSVYVQRVSGPIMKNDGLCSYGTETMRKNLETADNNENIIGHLLVVDSPGGQVSGTELLTNTIKGLSKPSLALVDDMAASAGYWIASAADRIIATESTATVGSIGVMVTLKDMSGAYEKLGIKIKDFYADGSEDKNKAFSEALAGNDKPLKEELLNPIRTIFKEAVIANRGEKLNQKTTLSGKTFSTKAAIENGLIDGMGSFEDAIDWIRSQSSGGTTASTNQPSISNQKSDRNMSLQSIHASLKNVISRLGLSVPEGEAKTKEEFTEAHLIQLNEELGSLAAVEKERDAAQASVKDFEEKLKASEEKNTELTAEVATLTAKVEELGKKPGAKHHNPKKDGADEIEGAAKDDAFESETDAELSAMLNEINAK